MRKKHTLGFWDGEHIAATFSSLGTVWSWFCMWMQMHHLKLKVCRSLLIVCYNYFQQSVDFSISLLKLLLSLGTPSIHFYLQQWKYFHPFSLNSFLLSGSNLPSVVEVEIAQQSAAQLGKNFGSKMGTKVTITEVKQVVLQFLTFTVCSSLCCLSISLALASTSACSLPLSS